MLFCEANNPLVTTKHFINANNTTDKKLLNKYQLQKYLLTKVVTETLQNKNKITKLSKQEAGGDQKHVYFFTRPYHQTLRMDESEGISTF